ncbi:ClpP/crotonase-like domain-containing protein [Haematococcus lacustris]
MHNHASYCSSSSSSSSSSASSSTGSPAVAGLNPSLHVTVEPLSEAYEGISLLSLSRTDARNAIGRQLLRELLEAVNTLRQERSTRCVVLRSTVPGVFSAGADLKERAGMTQAETKEFVNRLRRVFNEVHALPMPVVAVIEGFALGGGAELALAADIRVASDDAVFAFPEAQLGIIPGAGGTQRLPRLVGASRAKDLIFTGRRVAAGEALDMGLVDHRVPTPQAYDKALHIASSIARCAPLALRMSKVAINQGLDMDLTTGLHWEEMCYAQLVPSKDRLEGLAAFAEKRKPMFNGE